jgi:SPW repeat-containing protein
MLRRSKSSQGARAVNLLLGVWLFLSAFAWTHTGAERVNTWVMGALCAVFAAIAMSVATARWLNTALAIWLFISVWALPHHSLATMWNNALVAIAVFALSLVPGEGEHRLVTDRATT